MLVCSIKGFADVRNGLGYTIGDILLQEDGEPVSPRPSRPGDTVARLVGDEFGVLLEDIGDRDHAIELAERLNGDFSAPFETMAGELTVRMSVGVIATSAPQADAGELVRAAALAMHAASATGRGDPVAFTPGMDASATERLRLAQDLCICVQCGGWECGATLVKSPDDLAEYAGRRLLPPFPNRLFFSFLVKR